MPKYICPAITPLTEGGTIDENGLFALYDHLISGGVDGILALGSIGEFFSLPYGHRQQLIRLALQADGGRVPLLIGTGSPVLSEVLSLSEEALSLGADAVIIVPPYYFSLGGPEIEAWYDAIAERLAPGRIYLYNFPDRTGYSIPPETVLHLRERHPNIVGIKDTISGMDHTRDLIRLLKPAFPDFEIYSGFDDNFAHNVLSGGDGCIAGLSNVAPELCHAWAQALSGGDLAISAALQQKFNRLMAVYAVGSPFIPYIKAAVSLRGLPVVPVCTPPLPRPEGESIRKLEAILKAEGLIA